MVCNPLILWWARAELNCRHSDFQSDALPTELPAHKLTKYLSPLWKRVSKSIFPIKYCLECQVISGAICQVFTFVHRPIYNNFKKETFPPQEGNPDLILNATSTRGPGMRKLIAKSNELIC